MTVGSFAGQKKMQRQALELGTKKINVRQIILKIIKIYFTNKK